MNDARPSDEGLRRERPRSTPPNERARGEAALAYEMDTMAPAVNYRRWLYHLIRPYLGDQVLVAGARNGEFADVFSGHDRVVATEKNEEWLEALHARFDDRPAFEVSEVDVEVPITAGKFDSVVAINLLEHLGDDSAALENMAASLRPGGRLIIFVPAFPALFGPLDEAVGHRRRYTRASLERTVSRARLEIESMRFVNSIGMLAWWLFVRALRGTRVGDGTLKFYDRVVFPLVTRLETLAPPPFGQSLLCIARLPTGESEVVERTRAESGQGRRGFRKLSVIMPVYNEEAHVIDTLDRVLKVELQKGIEMEVIVVDDGSTDRTAALLERYETNPLVVVHTSRLNLGKGTAVRVGLAHATGDIMIIQDADREYSPDDYPALIQPIIDGKADVVYGTRFAIFGEDSAGGRRGKRLIWPEKMPLLNFIANVVLRWTTNLLFAADITDEASAYKVFESDVISELALKSRRFEICPELTAKVLRNGHRIYEVPISYSARRLEQGRKIRWYDLIEAVWTLFKYRFAPIKG